MRIGEVIGSVTLIRCHESLTGLPLKVAIPLSLYDLHGKTKPSAEPLVVVDVLGAGNGSRIAISESMEAAAPFRPAIKPIDAYNAAILDQIDLAK